MAMYYYVSWIENGALFNTRNFVNILLCINNQLFYTIFHHSTIRINICSKWEKKMNLTLACYLIHLPSCVTIPHRRSSPFVVVGHLVVVAVDITHQGKTTRSPKRRCVSGPVHHHCCSSYELRCLHVVYKF